MRPWRTRFRVRSWRHQKIARSNRPVIAYDPPSVALPATSSTGFQPDPYVDYGRVLTAAGGILIAYKDLDTRLRHTIWRLFAWTASTGCEGWFLLYHSPVHSGWINIACLIAIAVINGLIVAKPVELYRRIEIRPDCMIIEDGDLFWRRYMEGGRPSFQPDKKGNQLLCGICRHALRRISDRAPLRRVDRMPEVIAAHLQDAMRQLWSAAPI